MSASTYSALHLIGRWAAMLQQLAGEPLPVLPALPGRRHGLPPIAETDDYAERYDAEHARQPRSTHDHDNHA